MAKANAELEEKIAQEGQEKFLIDKHLFASEEEKKMGDINAEEVLCTTVMHYIAI